MNREVNYSSLDVNGDLVQELMYALSEKLAGPGQERLAELDAFVSRLPEERQMHALIAYSNGATINELRALEYERYFELDNDQIEYIGP